MKKKKEHRAAQITLKSCDKAGFFWQNQKDPTLVTLYEVLRSAVGMTHDLRSDLWWTIPLRILLGQFLGYLVVRLYSEIDHIHLSSEAQCVSHLYPQVDCHTSASAFHFTIRIFWCKWSDKTDSHLQCPIVSVNISLNTASSIKWLLTKMKITWHEKISF